MQDWERESIHRQRQAAIAAHEQSELMDGLKQENRRLTAELADARKVCDSFARRIAAQAELLAKRAEKPVDYGQARILYTNWRGETRWRTIRPLRFYFGQNEWHKTPGVLIDAVDLDSGEQRTFSLQGVGVWLEGLIPSEKEKTP